MQNDERNVIFFQTLATILLRSFLFGLAFLSAYAEDHGLCPWMNA
jgi:hypothetical protein